MRNGEETAIPRRPGTFHDRRRRAGRPARRVARSAIALLALAPVGAAAQESRGEAGALEPTASHLEPGATYESPHGPLAADLDCSACHDASGWGVDAARIDFDHSRSGFALAGGHAGARCAACHLDLRFDAPDIAEADCASCHSDVHRGVLGTDCVACHDTDSFTARMDPVLHARTSFPLTGSHLLVHCESCHVDDRRARFDALDTDCYSCHRPDYVASTAVDHVGLGYSTACLECHNTVAWFNRARTPADPPEASRGSR